MTKLGVHTDRETSLKKIVIKQSGGVNFTCMIKRGGRTIQIKPGLKRD